MNKYTISVLISILMIFNGCSNTEKINAQNDIKTQENQTDAISELTGDDLNTYLGNFAGIYCDMRLMANEFWIQYYSPTYTKMRDEANTDISVMNMLGEYMLNKQKVENIDSRLEELKNNPLAKEFAESIRLLDLANNFQKEYFEGSSKLLSFDEFTTGLIQKQLAFAQSIKKIQPTLTEEHDEIIGEYDNLFSVESLFIYIIEDNCGEAVWKELSKQEGQQFDVSLATGESQNEENNTETTNDAFIDVPDVSTLSRSDNNAYYVYGTTSSNCSKLIVEAKNADAGIYDNYELENYKYGDTSFKYGIREDWNNLAEGSNEYTFTAYCDNNQIVNDYLPLEYEIVIPPINTNYNYPITPSSIPDTTGYSINTDDISYLYTNEADIFVECDDELVYLGKIAGKYDSDSIFNKYGDHGSKYGDTIWAKYSDYGSKYSDCSPFDKYSSTPPMIYINDILVGYLSKNKYAGTNVIDPNNLLIFAYQKWDDDHWLDLMQD